MTAVLREPIVFVFAVVGWSVMHLAWQGLILGVASEALLLGLRRSAPRYREWIAGLALVLLLGAFAVTGFRVIGGAFELGPARLAGPGVTLPPGWLSTLAPWVGGAWALIASLLLVRLLSGLAHCGKLRSNGVTPASPTLVAGLDRLRASMRIERRVPLLVSSCIDVPALVGWRAPAILLPARALEQMAQPEIEAMLAHELAHLRRWDRWTKGLGQVARSLLFFHPVAHRLLGHLDSERELACDDLAVAACGSPLLYARALASLEHARQEKGMRILAADGAPLVARVRRIVDPGSTLHDRVGRGLAIAGIAALFFLAQGSTAPPHLAGPCLPDVIADRILDGHMPHHAHRVPDRDVIRIKDIRKTPHQTDP